MPGPGLMQTSHLYSKRKVLQRMGNLFTKPRCVKCGVSYAIYAGRMDKGGLSCRAHEYGEDSSHCARCGVKVGETKSNCYHTFI